MYLISFSKLDKKQSTLWNESDSPKQGAGSLTKLSTPIIINYNSTCKAENSGVINCNTYRVRRTRQKPSQITYWWLHYKSVIPNWIAINYLEAGFASFMISNDSQHLKCDMEVDGKANGNDAWSY